MVFLSHLYINAVFLPRQARDKHRESTQKRLPFSQVPELLGLRSAAPIATETVASLPVR
jgi:hypothetical protein